MYGFLTHNWSLVWLPESANNVRLRETHLVNYSEDSDYYAILKVSVDADGKSIKSAYRKMMKQLHPDTHKIYDTTEEVALINAANDVLSNPSKRQEYYNQRENYYTSGAWMDSPESLARLAL